MHPSRLTVIPAKAGILASVWPWIPAFAEALYNSEAGQ
jgi:hypothetical protein